MVAIENVQPASIIRLGNGLVGVMNNPSDVNEKGPVALVEMRDGKVAEVPHGTEVTIILTALEAAHVVLHDYYTPDCPGGPLRMKWAALALGGLP